MTEKDKTAPLVSADSLFAELPDHLLIEIFIRVPMSNWGHISCVKRHWANLFQEEYFWYAALVRSFPLAGQAKRWPGPIPRGLSKRRYAALHVSKNIFAPDEEIDEIVGHTYLFLKEQLEISAMPLPSGILHGMIIDQFIACGKSQEKAYELASLIWLAVIDNLEETEQTFSLLKRLALEGDVSKIMFSYHFHTQDPTKCSGECLKGYLQIFVIVSTVLTIMICFLVQNKNSNQYHQRGWDTSSVQHYKL